MQDTTGDWFVKELSSSRQEFAVLYWLDNAQDGAVLAVSCVCRGSLNKLIISYREGFPPSAPLMSASAFCVYTSKYVATSEESNNVRNHQQRHEKSWLSDFHFGILPMLKHELPVVIQPSWSRNETDLTE